MLEFYLKLINHERTFNEALPKIIEAFVSYYGEENRDEIEKKFSETAYVTFLSDDKLRTLLIQIKNEISKYLLLDLEHELDISYEERKALFENNETSIEFNSLFGIEKIKRYIELEKLGKEGRIQAKIEEGVSFLQRINPNINMDNYLDFINSEGFKEFEQTNKYIFDRISEYFDGEETYEYRIAKKNALEVVNQMYPLVPENSLNNFIMNEKFEKIIEVYESKKKEFDLFVKKLEKMEQRLIDKKDENDKLYSKLLEELYEKYADYVDSSMYTREKNASFDKLFDYYFKSDGIFAFTSESNELLESDAAQWRKDSIKDDRIRFFNRLGYDYGNDYSLYEECFKLLPPQEIIDSMKDDFEKGKEKIEIQLLCDNEYQDHLKELRDLQLVCGANYYSASLLKNTQACVCPDYRVVDGKEQIYPMLFVSMSALDEYMDDVIIHEFNHRYELSLESVDKNKITFLCGWDYLVQDSEEEIDNSLEEDNTKRGYELFNEIINELIAQEITELMHKNNVYLFNSDSFGKVRGGTSYELMRPIVEEFFVTYKEAILESRKNGNIEAIFNVVGRENFDKLNDLLAKYNSKFSNIFKLGETRKKMRSGIVDEDTRELSEIEIERDQILDEMKEYSLQMNK